MSNTGDIKKRLANIQNHFNPEKSTYKVLNYVINTELSSFGMLTELSKIRGVYNYPEDIKREYISIINDLKEIIMEERRAEYKRKQEESTRDLRNLIARLEKRKDLQPDNLKSVVDVDNKSLNNDNSISSKTDIQVEQAEKGNNDAIIKEDINNIVSKKDDDIVNDDKDKISFVNTVLMISVFVAIVIIILILLFY